MCKEGEEELVVLGSNVISTHVPVVRSDLQLPKDPFCSKHVIACLTVVPVTTPLQVRGTKMPVQYYSKSIICASHEVACNTLETIEKRGLDASLIRRARLAEACFSAPDELSVQATLAVFIL